MLTNLPADLWDSAGAESVQQPLMTQRHLINYGDVVSRRLIVHRPSTANEFETAGIYQMLHKVSCLK